MACIGCFKVYASFHDKLYSKWCFRDFCNEWYLSLGILYLKSLFMYQKFVGSSVKLHYLLSVHIIMEIKMTQRRYLTAVTQMRKTLFPELNIYKFHCYWSWMCTLLVITRDWNRSLETYSCTNWAFAKAIHTICLLGSWGKFENELLIFNNKMSSTWIQFLCVLCCKVVQYSILLIILDIVDLFA